MSRGGWGRVGFAALFGAVAGIGRVRLFETLSPPDLAFFFQSAREAARGRGFSQTALGFDQGDVFSGIHLSVVRFLHPPLTLVWDHPAVLAAFQGALVLGGLAALPGLLGRAPGSAGMSERKVTLLAAILVFNPMSLALATCDVRPLVGMVPAVGLLTIGIFRRHTGLLAAGALACIAEREEAVFVLGALLPVAALRGGPRSLVGLGLFTVLAWAWPRLIWGHGANVQANQSLLDSLYGLFHGERPWMRAPVEWTFLARSLVATVLLVRQPLLAAPGLFAWCYLLFFSDWEPVAPGHGGLHYLSVAAAPLLAAHLMGAQPLSRHTLRLLLAIQVVFTLPELTDHARWLAGGLGWQSQQAAAYAALIQPSLRHELPVVAVSPLAPSLAGRPTIWIQGHFAVDAAVAREKVSLAQELYLPEGVRFPVEPEAADWARALATEGLVEMDADSPTFGVVGYARPLTTPRK